GTVDVLNGGEQWMRMFGADGALSAEAGTLSGTAPLVASPTVASIGGKTWVVQSSGFVSGSDGIDIGGVWGWTTNTGLGAAPWPMFKHDAARTGSAAPLPSGAVTERPVAVTPATAPRTTTSRPRSSTRSAPSPTTTAAPTTTTEAPATTTS